jgi:hypothetical protein
MYVCHDIPEIDGHQIEHCIHVAVSLDNLHCIIFVNCCMMANLLYTMDGLHLDMLVALKLFMAILDVSCTPKCLVQMDPAFP